MKCPPIKDLVVKDSAEEHSDVDKLVYVYLESDLSEIPQICQLKYQVAASESIESDNIKQGHIIPGLTESEDADIVFGVMKEKDDTCLSYKTGGPDLTD